MQLSEFKQHLNEVNGLNFILPDGTRVPEHFHVTEVGQVTKHFIDCGGTVRKEKAVSFQLWEAQDTDHRLAPVKLRNIIALSERTLGIEDAAIEVEYQGTTIGKYGLVFNGSDFVLTALNTACLASDKCGIPANKQQANEINATAKVCCAPGSGCC